MVLFMINTLLYVAMLLMCIGPKNDLYDMVFLGVDGNLLNNFQAMYPWAI